MKTIQHILKKYQGRKMLLVFAHPDDESFLTAGLLQAAKKYNVETHLICLTKGEMGTNGLKKGDIKEIRTQELNKAAEILGIDKLCLWDYSDANLRNSVNSWFPRVACKIRKVKPDILVTFDHSGITGHPDHVIISKTIFDYLKNKKQRPLFLWRVTSQDTLDDHNEKRASTYASDASHVLKLDYIKALIKIRAICAHKSQINGIKQWFRVFKVNLIIKKEYYYQVDFSRSYKYRFAKYKLN